MVHLRRTAKNDNELTMQLLDKLNARYQIRKNTTQVSMVTFIKNPIQQSTDPLYWMLGRTTIVRNLKSLHVRLFETEETSIVAASEDREEVSDLSMTSRLSLLLDQSKISNPVSDTFMKEVQLFAAGGEKTAAISQLYPSLLTIPPTSVETKRVFSAGGLFLTKLRTNLSDMSLDKLIFLRFFLKLKTDKVL